MDPEDLSGLGKELYDEESEYREYRLSIGEYALITPPDKISCHGIGSCLIIVLYDPASGVGIGVHTLLPSYSNHQMEGENDKSRTRFTDTAIEHSLNKLQKHPKVKIENIVAKMTGGSEVLRGMDVASNVGKSNIDQARETFQELGVNIVAEDVGGDYGRIVEFDSTTGGLIVRKSNGEQQVI